MIEKNGSLQLKTGCRGAKSQHSQNKLILRVLSFSDDPLAPFRKSLISENFFGKIDRFQSRMAQLTEHPLKSACTFWNSQGKTFP